MSQVVDACLEARLVSQKSEVDQIPFVFKLDDFLLEAPSKFNS
tara:strand:- start:195 stop:323 length:129 start_codon:yes stop_codon:yes gene_type:complete